MPKTKLQEYVLTIFTVFFMVYCMTLYNIALQSGELTYPMFLLALREMWMEYVIVFALAHFIVSPIAMKLTLRLFSFQDKPIFIIVTMSSFMVCLMVTAMSLIVALLHNGFVPAIGTIWLRSLVFNFLFAYPLQIFAVGPLCRLLMRLVCRKQIKRMETEQQAVFAEVGQENA